MSEPTYDQLSERCAHLEAARVQAIGALRMARIVVRAAGRTDELAILDATIAELAASLPLLSQIDNELPPTDEVAGNAS